MAPASYLSTEPGLSVAMPAFSPASRVRDQGSLVPRPICGTGNEARDQGCHSRALSCYLFNHGASAKKCFNKYQTLLPSPHSASIHEPKCTRQQYARIYSHTTRSWNADMSAHAQKRYRHILVKCLALWGERERNGRHYSGQQTVQHSVQQPRRSLLLSRATQTGGGWIGNAVIAVS